MADAGLDTKIDVSTKVTDFLDKSLGKGICSTEKIQSLLKDFKKKREQLHFQLREADKATPVKVQRAVTSGLETVNDLEELSNAKQELATAVDKHASETKPVIEKLSPLAEEVVEMERFKVYISWILKLETISCDIQGCLDSGLMGSAIEKYSLLNEASSLLCGTSCENLMKFLENIKSHWHKILLDKLASEFDEVVKALKWPFTAESSAPPLSTKTDVYKTMERVFILMLKLQDFQKVSVKDGSRRNILLPLDWLLKPLRKRFRFHFYGNKQTNSLEKPEWYFTQVLNWIKSHGDFLEHAVQPILDKTQFQSVDAKSEFIYGLLMVVIEKMESSVPELLDDETMFSHFVDETLLFDKELHTLYHYSSYDHSCLRVLTQSQCLDRWLELEKKYAMDNIESILSLPNAFKQKYQEVGNVDDTKTSECAESFITLLMVITDRYRSLQEKSHQLRFLGVQLELLDHFIAKLQLEAEERSADPVTLDYCSIINATSYIVQILQEWSDQAFFLQLHEYQRQQYVAACLAESDKQVDGCNKNSEKPEKHESLALAGSLFEKAVRVLKEMKRHMLSVLVEHILQNFKVKSKAYKKERWHSLPPQKEFIIMVLSSSACDMMLFLKDKLQFLETNLSNVVFSNLWRGVAEALDGFIYKEIILNSHFNEGGAAQLQFDMTKNLFVLFGDYSQKPENFFKQVKEACILLNLRPGSAVLLGEVLKDTSSDPDLSSPQAAINDVGVYRLAPKDVAMVLGLRINWTAS